MTVTVTPDEFTMVHFSNPELTRITEDLVGALGIERAVEVVVNERTPMGTLQLRSLDPIVCYVESGALEDPKRVRYLSPQGATEAIGRVLLEARDRMTDGFGAPELGQVIPVPQRVAWDTYIVARLVRLGGREQRQRRLFGFRNKHGFTDSADRAFNRLWDAEPLTWNEIAELSDSLTAVR